MQAALAIGLIVLSAIAGWLLAKFKVTFWRRAIVYVSLWLVSLLIACIPYFLREPRTWIQTYSSAAMLEGIPLFLLHVFPAILVFHATKLCLNRKKHSPECR